MSFPRYPSYKDSGVEWLGEVPAHWEVSALKRNFHIVGGSTPKSETASFWDGDILWATPSDLSKIDSLYLDETQRKITDDGLASCGTSLVPADSIILSTRAPIGSLAIAAVPICTNQGCKSLIPAESANSKYFAHLLSISSTELNIRGRGTTFLELSGDELGAFKAPLPSLTEQTQIATFLDRETAKIDELVAAQRRLMELLKEKRQAVISHAVTKGLNPDAPMKPSGIEWLGEVPAHWETIPLSRVAAGTHSLFIDGDWIESKDLSDDGIRYLTSGNVGEGYYKEQGQGYISQETFANLNCIEVLPGDVLISRLNLPIGRSCLVPELGSRIVTCVDNVIVRPDPHFDRRFFVYQLSSKSHFANMENLARGTTMQRISRSTLGRVRFAFPPFPEQTQIATFLDRETAKIDDLVTEAQRAIDLLQERRTALISAAVTGQIDVRQLTEKQAA